MGWWHLFHWNHLNKGPRAYRQVVDLKQPNMTKLIQVGQLVGKIQKLPGILLSKYSLVCKIKIL